MKYLKLYRRLEFIALLPLATLVAGCGSSHAALYADHGRGQVFAGSGSDRLA